LLLFQSVHLDQDQRTVFSLIDGAKSIQEICVLSGIGDFNTLKAIYALLALRMAVTGEIKTAEGRVVSAFVRETVAADEKKDKKDAAPEIPLTRETIQNAFDLLGRQNHYEVLEVDHGATALEIKNAYFHLAKRYHPDRHLEPEMSDMKEKLEALFSRIHDAYGALGSQTTRDQYDRDLASGAERAREEEKAHQGISASRETARAQYLEGLKQYNRGNFWGAEEAFEWATRLDPGNAEYLFRRGLTLARIPRRGHEAEEHLVRAIEKAPNKSEYHLELGNFYARSGLKEKALTAYQNALRYDRNSDKIKKAIHKISG
jgi:curved DNA-binding protein CbpA